MASSTPDPYLAHVDTAWRQLAAGKRPSADSVLREVGGSKSTAVAAMNYFWASYIPDLLAGRSAGTAPPKPVEDLAARTWRLALDLATEQADSAVAGERKALAEATAAAEAERRASGQAVLALKAQLAETRAACEREQRDALERLRTRLGQTHDLERSRAEARLATAETTIGSLREAVQQLQDQLQASRGELGQAQQALAVQSAELAAAQQAQATAATLAQERQAALQAAGEQLQAQADAHAAERQALTAQANTTLATLSAQHDKQIGELNDRHNVLVEALKLDHIRAIDELKKAIKKDRDAQGKRRVRAAEQPSP